MTEEQLERLRRIGGIVAAVCRLMGSRLEPGMTTRELDEIGRAALEREGSRPAPSLMYGFPGATCISINHAVAHGVPDDTRLAPGDMVNIDVSAERDGVFADTGASFVVPPSRADQERLCRSTRKALNRAVQAVRPGRRLNVIGHTIERTASADGYTVIRNLGSHGVGDSLHDEVPGFIPGYYDRDDRRIMTPSLHDRALPVDRRDAGGRAGRRLDPGHRSRDHDGAVRAHAGGRSPRRDRGDGVRRRAGTWSAIRDITRSTA